MKLAVLLTYHNEGSLLTECLASLASQSRQADEVWVYDDASTVPASDHLGAFAGLGGGVRIVRGEKNIGPARGRNRILNETRADAIHFHDSDDLFLPGWCERVAGAFETGSVDLVLTELRSERDGKPYSDRFLKLADLAMDPDLIRFTLRSAILPAAGTYRREFVVACGGYREDLWQSEDYEFHVRLAEHGACYRFITTPLVLIRVRGESRSQKLGEVWEGRLAGLEHLAPQLQATYTRELAEAFCEAGSQLHRLGKVDLAKRAFDTATALGGARYGGQQILYRWVARLFGPLAAEQLGEIYRRILPGALRARLRQ
jgi:glycosyltransferase involved in cell wall biosynthesis